MSIQKSIIATLLLILFVKLFGNFYAGVFRSLFGESYKSYGFFTYSIIELIAVIFFVFKLEKRSISGIFKTRIIYYFVGLSLGLSFIFIQTPLNYIFNFFSEFDINLTYGFQVPKINTLRLIGSIILLSIAEEIFFRHYLQKGLMLKHKPIIAILLTTVLFSFVHLPLEGLFVFLLEINFNPAFIAFFGGFLSALLYYKSKSLGPSIIFHIGWNFGAYFFLS